MARPRTGLNRFDTPRLRSLHFDSPVGRWSLFTWAPAPDLDHAVEQLWAVEASTREFQERVLPRRTVELMINLGDPHEVLHEGGHTARHRHAWVSGLQTRCLHVHSRTAARLIAASLKPAYAGLVVGARSDELTGQVIEWDQPRLSPFHWLRPRRVPRCPRPKRPGDSRWRGVTFFQAPASVAG